MQGASENPSWLLKDVSTSGRKQTAPSDSRQYTHSFNFSPSTTTLFCRASSLAFLPQYLDQLQTLTIDTRSSGPPSPRYIGGWRCFSKQLNIRNYYGRWPRNGRATRSGGEWL